MVIVLGIRFHFYRILHSITYIHSRDSCTTYLLLRQCNSFEIIVSLWCAINLLKMEILQQILCETNSPFFLCIYISKFRMRCPYSSSKVKNILLMNPPQWKVGVLIMIWPMLGLLSSGKGDSHWPGS